MSTSLYYRYECDYCGDTEFEGEYDGLPHRWIEEDLSDYMHFCSQECRDNWHEDNDEEEEEEVQEDKTDYVAVLSSYSPEVEVIDMTPVEEPME